MKASIAIIGSGFSSLAAASYLAQAGHWVTIYEKNETIGGRARQFQKEGFTFDMGPTWYWMPDVFERFFQDFGKHPSDYYELEKLNPAYTVYFGKEDTITIEDTLEKICMAFEREEEGSSKKLRHFMDMALDNYNIAIKDLVYRPGVSPLELVTPVTMKKIGQFFSTISKEVRKEFTNPKLIAILEFPVLFLGAKPSDTPAFYSFMNYADFGLGTFHPKKGMHAVIQGMETLARSLGVTIKTNHPVSEVLIDNRTVTGIRAKGMDIDADVVVSGADYHHTEQLLPKPLRQYSEAYWNKRTFAPSALLFYVGFEKPLKNVEHHTLFFDVPFEAHAVDIYDLPNWPKEPLFYASFPSKTDTYMAPEGKEAGIFLIPLAPGLDDTSALREEYFEKIISRFESLTQQDVKNSIIFKESFCIEDFVKEYNSYKGNAYGLANTLLQTAFLRPNLKSNKVKQLFFTGQLTVPGPGVPPALISGKLVAGLVENSLQKKHQKSKSVAT
ncbi:phytoene desaturase family protein [Altibacter sp. HG106]|uniref:phytoene desaturase family protein n=1 Tax=Altibacter sp. HG106 TaxID=3023937 RepID=UPI002350DF29|nr:phytoene desaturase family protein [Altibacter sp. HG106]MDC7996290.1 phytoene desaturase family protein [Altibacter sp. HG106]